MQIHTAVVSHSNKYSLEMDSLGCKEREPLSLVVSNSVERSRTKVCKLAPSSTLFQDPIRLFYAFQHPITFLQCVSAH